ncbi:(2Fe-2S)-binding protein, partial [Hymenobacter rigui]
MKQAGGLLGLALAPPFAAQAERLASYAKTVEGVSTLQLKVNGTVRTIQAEPRVTLLDALREYLDLTGTKKGCDHGQCGACTVHVDGKRINSCLTLAVMQQGKEITTIEGLAKGEELHPMQEAFIKHDGFQCGYCTPGQIMSGVACVNEGHASSDSQCREWMSGNLCRCGAYPNIVAAVREVAKGGA